MVWAGERPIDTPLVRKAWTWAGEVPGWKLIVNYESGHREETWQNWRDAVDRALVAADNDAAEMVETAPFEAHWAEAVHRYRTVVPVLDATSGPRELMP